MVAPAIRGPGFDVNHAMFPIYLCDNSFRDITYDELDSVISNTVQINGFRCRRACSVSSLARPAPPAGGSVRGTHFVVHSLCGWGVVGLGAVGPRCAVASRRRNIAC
jgi:hypothetical protein